MLFILENRGVFDFFLPFLLVFALVYGILNYIDAFKRTRGVNVIIALVIGLMATRFPFFNNFYSELFPRLGIGVIILLSILILFGFFKKNDNRSNIIPWTLLGVGAIILISILYQSFSHLGWIWGGGMWDSEIVEWVILASLLLVVLIVIITGNSREGGSEKNG